MLIDTHAHLSFPQFQHDLVDVIGRARDAGGTRIVDVVTNLETGRKASGLAVVARRQHGGGAGREHRITVSLVAYTHFGKST